MYLALMILSHATATAAHRSSDLFLPCFNRCTAASALTLLFPSCCDQDDTNFTFHFFLKNEQVKPNILVRREIEFLHLALMKLSHAAAATVHHASNPFLPCFNRCIAASAVTLPFTSCCDHYETNYIYLVFSEEQVS